MSAGGGFSELVQQASRLTSDMDTAAPLPRVQRNLKQLLQAGEQLWARTAQTGAQDVKASILLGSKGVDLPALSQRLEALDASRTFQPLEPVHDTDIAGFLRNERENAVLTVIEQSRKETFETVDRAHYDAFQSCWEREKHRLLSILAPSGHDELLDVTIQPELSVSSASGPAGARSSLSTQEKAYVETIDGYITQLNSAGPRPDLVATCRQLMAKLGDDVAVELWDAVRCVTQVEVRSEVGRFSSSVQSAMIREAKHFLEASYVSRLRRLVYSHLSVAGLGGEPGTLQLVQSYLAVRPPPAAPDDALLHGLPVWAVIYHCLRCGDPAAARQAAQQAGPGLADVARILAQAAASPDGRLRPETLSDLRQMQYSRATGVSDHYTRAVCSALGASDLSEDAADAASLHLSSTDDFLWLRLSGLSALAGSEQQATALRRLQDTLLEKYGESHFDAYNQPALYFRVLLLTGQLEAAVEFLARVEKLRPHGVHIALALHELRLLLLSPSPQAPLLSEPDSAGRRRLNLARLVLLYTRRFEAAEPEAALHYLFLLSRLDGGQELFAAATAELVLQSASYETLLGRMAADGKRQPGALDRYNFDPRPVIERVADECESRGQLEDAVQLYDLADNHDKVLELLNRLLSQLVSSTDTLRRDRLQRLAIAIAQRFKLGHRGSTESAGTLYLLLDLMAFFDLYRLRRTDEALEVLRRLRLVPLSQTELELRLAEFSRLQEEVRRCMPDVLLAAMTLLHAAQRAEAGRAPTELRQAARLLITFAGSLPYRLPGDTHARLVQMEVLMN